MAFSGGPGPIYLPTSVEVLLPQAEKMRVAAHIASLEPGSTAGAQRGSDQFIHPYSYNIAMPAFWRDDLAYWNLGALGNQGCVIRDQHFIRGDISLRITDTEAFGYFVWGVWVLVSVHTYTRAYQMWATKQYAQEPMHEGYLASEIPIYRQSTLNIKASILVQSNHRTAGLSVSDANHPLAGEQRDGITLARVHEIAEWLCRSGHGNSIAG